MEPTLDLIKELAVIAIVCWLVYKFFAPPIHPMPRGPEKMCEPWWKHQHL